MASPHQGKRCFLKSLPMAQFTVGMVIQFIKSTIRIFKNSPAQLPLYHFVFETKIEFTPIWDMKKRRLLKDFPSDDLMKAKEQIVRRSFAGVVKSAAGSIVEQDQMYGACMPLRELELDKTITIGKKALQLRQELRQKHADKFSPQNPASSDEVVQYFYSPSDVVV